MKKLFALLLVLSMVTLIVVACGGVSSTANQNLPNTVHMGDQAFLQSSITITKGSSVNIVDDTATIHIINNGEWDNNGNPIPKQEPDAPTVNIQFNGNDSHLVGPFNSAGTFRLYCTVHPGMNLTVIVQ